MHFSTKALYTLAFLVIVGSGIFLARKYTPTSTSVATQTATPTVTPTTSPSPSASGTPYVNTAYGYEFRYPSALNLWDQADPRTPVSGTTKGLCVTVPASGYCSFEATLVTTTGPTMLTDSYIKSVYPKYNAQYDILSNTTLNGLSGIQVVNGGYAMFT